MKLVRVNGVSLINLKKTLGSQTITVYGTTYFAAARSAVALRILSSCARLELHCCLELKPNGGQKGYHRMSTLRLERFDFVISALWGMGFTNWICVTSPVSDQAYFTFWKPAKPFDDLSSYANREWNNVVSTGSTLVLEPTSVMLFCFCLSMIPFNSAINVICTENVALV